MEATHFSEVFEHIFLRGVIIQKASTWFTYTVLNKFINVMLVETVDSVWYDTRQQIRYNIVSC